MNDKIISAKDRIILALDVDSIEDTIKYVDLLKDYVGFFKVGMPLMASCGFHSIDVIKEHGGKIYFDGKYQDIPHTTAQTCVNLMKRGIDFFNISATGGSKMLSTTVEACREYAKKQKIKQPVILAVLQLSKLAKQSGLQGVIVPDTDAKKIKAELGEDFIVVCPAVRPTWAIVNDQIRIVSPSDAIKAGFDYIIIGRPITEAKDPVAAAKMVIAEIEEALVSDDE